MATLASRPLVLPLRGLSAGDLAIAGGKATGLGELLAGGFDVPDGFVITTEAYRRVMTGLDPREAGDAQVGPGADAVRHAPVPHPVVADILAAYADLGQGMVAVRSSATAEDLPGAAFAGQHDTVLGVEGQDDLIDAVRTCWASLWSERAAAYRARLGVCADQLSMAVVVQRLVPADFAGVMFTANPVTGAREQVVIDSSPGLGEAVVGGLVTPDHAVLDAAGRIVTRRDGRGEVVITAGTASAHGAGATSPADPPAVPEQTLVRLAELGRRVAARAGRPMDLEWAVTGKRLVLLQARPMTALPPAPRRLSRMQRQTGPVLLEMLPRRPTPMEVTAWLRPVVFPFVDQMYAAAAGLRVRHDDAIPTDDGVVTEFIPPKLRPTWRTPARVIGGLTRGRDPAGWARDRRGQAYEERCRELVAFDAGAASWAELTAVPDQVADAMALLGGARGEYQVAAAAAMGRLALVLALVRRTDAFAEAWVGADSVTTTANAELAGIAEEIRRDPHLSTAWRTDPPAAILQRLRTDPSAAAVRTRFEAFLAAYGHRETASIMLVRDPTWGEHPEAVVALIGVLLQTPGPDGRKPGTLDALVTDSRIRRWRLDQPLRRAIAAARAGVATREDTHLAATRLMPVVRGTIRAIGQRLAACGWLEDPADVWYLTWDEVVGLPDPAGSGPFAGATAARVASIARRRRDRYAELAATPLIAGPTLYPRSDEAASGALVRGTGAGGGRAAGSVRVIHGPSEFALLKAGEVLVCPVTNPSWTPLFARAAAVVVDHGGLSSHAAVVAREYGIPAVLGCATATTTLTSGQRVLVDGDRGLVTPG